VNFVVVGLVGLPVVVQRWGRVTAASGIRPAPVCGLCSRLWWVSPVKREAAAAAWGPRPHPRSRPPRGAPLSGRLL